MEDQFITAVKQAIQDRYQHKYGRVTIALDEVVPEKDHQARVQFTIHKANSFVTRYYGKAAFQDGQSIWMSCPFEATRKKALSCQGQRTGPSWVSPTETESVDNEKGSYTHFTIRLVHDHVTACRGSH